MRKVQILVDSTCDLYSCSKRNLIEAMDIGFVPYNVVFGDKTYKDFVDLKRDDMFKLVDELGYTPKTGAPSIQDYEDLYNKYLNEDTDIIFISLSSQLSSGFSNAYMAAGENLNKRIFIIDSLNLSSGIGLLVFKANKLRKEGKTAKEIYQELKTLIPKVRSRFVIDTFTYLHKGGRCTSINKFIGTLLQIKPVIEVKEGRMSVIHKARGKKAGLKYIYDLFLNDFNEGRVDLDNIMITHASVPLEAAVIKEKMIEANVPYDSIVTSGANCVISSHCGPKAIGILYIEK